MPKLKGAYAVRKRFYRPRGHKQKSKKEKSRKELKICSSDQADEVLASSGLGSSAADSVFSPDQADEGVTSPLLGSSVPGDVSESVGLPLSLLTLKLKEHLRLSRCHSALAKKMSAAAFPPKEYETSLPKLDNNQIQIEDINIEAKRIKLEWVELEQTRKRHPNTLDQFSELYVVDCRGNHLDD